MWTIRMWVPKRHGRTDLHLSNPDIQASSVVHISVSEASELKLGGFATGAPDFTPFLANAAITLQNVVVRTGGVDFRVHIDWPSPLNIVADITILNGPPNILIAD